MFRKLVLPAACAALLGGCVSYGYSDGGYYYGQPSVRYYGSAGYGYGYPYSSYPYSRYYGSRYGYGYGYPYGYGYGGYYRYPYYPYYPNYPRRPPGDHDHDGDHDDDDRDGKGKPPWRGGWATGGDAQRLRDNVRRQHAMPMSTPSQREAMVQRPAPRAEMPMRPVERRAMPERRMSEPAPRNNVRERDTRREQEP